MNDLTPLCVDLDGTLIHTDVTNQSLFLYIRPNPLRLFNVLRWFLRGRARLKQELARRTTLDPKTLAYHAAFLEYLRFQKAQGRTLLLVTACDQAIAHNVAKHVGLFEDVMASDGVTNLRQKAKSRALVARFGRQAFDYAGNSRDDLHVWKDARTAIAVNTPPNVLTQLRKMHKDVLVFEGPCS